MKQYTSDKIRLLQKPLRAIVLIAAAVAFYCLFLWWAHGFDNHFLDIDRCLDTGGRWNYELQRCED